MDYLALLEDEHFWTFLKIPIFYVFFLIFEKINFKILKILDGTSDMSN